MKKRVLGLVLFIICMSFISAAGIEIKLDKASYYPNELLKAEIFGTFPEGLKLENIAVYELDKVHPVPTESAILKLDTKYLYYAVLPALNETYSIKIKDAKYYSGQQTVSDTIIKNFTIENTDTPYLSISRGFISTTSDFSIAIKSLNAAQEVNAEFKATGEKKKINIGQNSERTLSFSIAGLDEVTESTLVINSYEIPVYVYPVIKGQEPFINNTDLIPKTAENTTASEETPETIPLETATPEQIQTCEDIDGKLCKSTEQCQGQTSFAKDIVCCLGTCVEKPKSKAWIGGIMLLVLLGAGVWFLYKRSKKLGKSKTEKEEIEERSKKFKERMNPVFPPAKEMHRGLTRQ